MKTDSTNQNEMTIDDGDNLVSDAWSSLVASSPALQVALRQQATARFLDMTPDVMKVIGQKKPRSEPFNFASLLT